jgi:drug/metabolite transporter (DMT)-like permease
MLGVWLVAASAVCFALAPIGAKLAYAGGSEPVTLIGLRFVLNVVAVLAMVAFGRHPYMLPIRALGASLLLGIMLAAEGVFYLAAVQFIPVSLAVVIVFTFPLQIGLLSALIGQERLNFARSASLVFAFLGVTLAVGVAADSVDWRGVVLAAATGSGIAVTAVSTSRLMNDHDPVTLTLFMTLSAAVSSMLAVLMWRGLVWPVTSTGWLGLTIAVVAFAAAITLYFLGLARIGAVRAAIIGNLEPVLAIAAAVVVLAERPTIVQLLGAAMIIGAIFALHIHESRRSAVPIASGRSR